ncbi:MAG: hypothetical protein ACJAW8_001740 [Oleispira sp.]
MGTVCLTVFKAVSRFLEALRSTTFSLNLRHFNLPLRIVNKQQQVERTKPQPRIATNARESRFILEPNYFFLTGASTIII